MTMKAGNRRNLDAFRRREVLALPLGLIGAHPVRAQSTSESSRAIARVYGREILESERRQATSIICNALIERFARDKGIEASSEEIQKFRLRVFGDWKKTENAETDFVVDKAESELARDMIVTWKVNLTLFREFGGRVIFQQVGPEPVDAYRDFLKRKQREGAFELIDESLAESFWYYYVTEKHTFISESRADGERILAVPPWE